MQCLGEAQGTGGARPGTYYQVGFKKASWRQQMLGQSLERLVIVSLAKKLGRVFQAEGTAWTKHRGPLQHSRYRRRPKAVRAHKRENGKVGMEQKGAGP